MPSVGAHELAYADPGVEQMAGALAAAALLLHSGDDGRIEAHSGCEREPAVLQPAQADRAPPAVPQRVQQRSGGLDWVVRQAQGAREHVRRPCRDHSECGYRVVNAVGEQPVGDLVDRPVSAQGDDDVDPVAHRPARQRRGVATVGGLLDGKLRGTAERVRKHIALALRHRGRRGVHHDDHAHIGQRSDYIRRIRLSGAPLAAARARPSSRASLRSARVAAGGSSRERTDSTAGFGSAGAPLADARARPSSRASLRSARVAAGGSSRALIARCGLGWGAMSVQPGTDRVPAQVRAAVVLVGLQGLAFAGGAVVLVVKTAVGHPDSVARALLGAAFALLGAVVLGACARGLLGLRAAARTPVVVIELLALPVGYSLGFQAGLMAYGAPILVSALAVLYLLFTPPARKALDREGPS